MTMTLPFSEAEIEFQEEGYLLKFRDEGSPWVYFELWVSSNEFVGDYLRMASWRGDMSKPEQETSITIWLKEEARAKAVFDLMMQDDSVGKCVRKFRALMLFAAYYREDIERTREVTRTSSGSKGKRGSSKRRALTVRRYTISDEMLSELPAPKREWHGYAESFGVRGHFRTLRSGKVIWVRPYEKKGRMDKKSDKEYVL